ncbi:MAG: transposase [Clostridiales bacterium]|nr:transposase [Clostridiales bacterium]
MSGLTSITATRMADPEQDPVVLKKMVLIQHLFGPPSLRQTYQEINGNIACRWFLCYSLLDKIPHFATVSYAFCIL